MKKTLILLSLMLVSCIMTAQEAENYRTVLEKGLNAKQLNMTELSESYFRKAHEIAPDSAEATLQIGFILEEREHFIEARDLFLSGIQQLTLTQPKENETTLADAYEHLASCLIELQDYDSALIKAQKAVELNPGSASAMTSIALAYNTMENYTNALSWAHKAIATTPDYARAYNATGIILYNKGNDNEAIMQAFTPTVSAQTYAYNQYGRNLDPESNTYNTIATFHNGFSVSGGKVFGRFGGGYLVHDNGVHHLIIHHVAVGLHDGQADGVAGLLLLAQPHLCCNRGDP